MKQFENKTAVVTGAASGIGRALAELFVRRGMNVVLADVEEKALAAAETAVAPESARERVRAFPTDVSQAESLEDLAKRAEDAFGNIHVVCNNAGVFAGGLSWNSPASDYEWVLGVNVWGVIHGVRTFVPRMLAHGEEGHVVNTASMAAVTAAPYCAAYNMSKHAVLALSETLHLELTSQQARIGVSALCPELVDTGIGHADRNRPNTLARADGTTPETELVESAIKTSTAGGVDPMVLAERTLAAIEANQFYILSDDGWRRAAEQRHEDIRLGRNPSLVIPGSD